MLDSVRFKMITQDSIQQWCILEVSKVKMIAWAATLNILGAKNHPFIGPKNLSRSKNDRRSWVASKGNGLRSHKILQYNYHLAMHK